MREKLDTKVESYKIIINDTHIFRIFSEALYEHKVNAITRGAVLHAHIYQPFIVAGVGIVRKVGREGFLLLFFLPMVCVTYSFVVL